MKSDKLLNIHVLIAEQGAMKFGRLTSICGLGKIDGDDLLLLDRQRCSVRYYAFPMFSSFVLALFFYLVCAPQRTVYQIITSATCCMYV